MTRGGQHNGDGRSIVVTGHSHAYLTHCLVSGGHKLNRIVAASPRLVDALQNDPKHIYRTRELDQFERRKKKKAGETKKKKDNDEEGKK